MAALKPEVLPKPPRDTFYDGLKPPTFFQRLQQRSRVLRAAVVLAENITGARTAWQEEAQPRPRKNGKALEADEVLKDGDVVALPHEKWRRYPRPIARAIDRTLTFAGRMKRRIRNIFIDPHEEALRRAHEAVVRYAKEYGPDEPIIMTRRKKEDKEPNP